MGKLLILMLMQLSIAGMAAGQTTPEASRAVILVIDKSGSMRDQNRMQYAKEAARAIGRQLDDTDYFGVVAFDLDPFVVIYLDQVGRLRGEMDQRIDQLKPGGQTHFFPALSEARRQLERIPAGRKHVVLLSDGVTRGRQGELVDLVEGMTRELRIKVSAIAVGADADARVMRRIAYYGGGAFHLVCSPKDLPKITGETVLSDGAARPELKQEMERCSPDNANQQGNLGPASTMIAAKAPFAERPLVGRDDYWVYELGDQSRAKINTLALNVNFPLSVGKKWQEDAEALPANRNDPKRAVPRTPVRITCHVSRFEQVAVRAGSFNAFRCECECKTISVAYEPECGEWMIWYAPDVKNILKTTNGAPTGALELIEYKASR